MVNIIREVDEELRKERYASLFKKYGAYVIGLIVIIVSLLISIQIYQSYKISSNEEIVENYINSIDMETDSIEEKILMIENFTDTKNIFVNGMSALKKADLLIENRQQEAAIKSLEDIINNKKIEKIHRDLGLYKYLMLSMNSMSILEFSEFSDKLNKESLFYYLIHELKATKLLLDGDNENANIEFNKLINDPLVTEDIKNRVSIFIEIVN